MVGATRRLSSAPRPASCRSSRPGTGLAPGSRVESATPRTLRPVPIAIDKRAWLGSNVTVLPGVTIGDGVVVATASVVTKDAPRQCRSGRFRSGADRIMSPRFLGRKHGRDEDDQYPELMGPGGGWRDIHTHPGAEIPGMVASHLDLGVGSGDVRVTRRSRCDDLRFVPVPILIGGRTMTA